MDPTDIKMEFAVKMSCQSCVSAVNEALAKYPGIKSFSVDLENQRVMVESRLPISKISGILESTGRQVIFRGLGSESLMMQKQDFGSGVIQLQRDSQVVGVCRLYQPTDQLCVVEGVVDGLPANQKLALRVHELGDLSVDCQSCGDVLQTLMTSQGPQTSSPAPGDLGTIMSDRAGRAAFEIGSSRLKLWEVIGRSLVVHATAQPDEKQRLACGIIARSSGLLANQKRACACSGATLWEEQDQIRQQASSATNNKPDAHI